MTERPTKSTDKPMAGKRKASAAAGVRAGCSPAHAEAVRTNFMAQNDLHSTCRHCGHVRRGNFEEVSAPCPRCRGGA